MPVVSVADGGTPHTLFVTLDSEAFGSGFSSPSRVKPGATTGSRRLQSMRGTWFAALWIGIRYLLGARLLAALAVALATTVILLVGVGVYVAVEIARNS